MIKDPLVLYLDEPTTGLDAYTAGTVMKTLKRMSNAGRTIVFSIHQPKYSIYRLFDRLTLIANGQMIYHGPAGRNPIDYFRRFGYVLEGYNNPADFLMDTIHGEVPITEASVELGEENEAVMDPEVDVLLPQRSTDASGSLRTTVIQRLLNFWRQSELFESCQQTVNAIARAYKARHVRSRSPSPSGVHSSNPVNAPYWSSSSTPSDRPRLGECRVQSAPVCRLLPSRLHLRGLPVRPAKQIGLCNSDISLR
ncbi:unnamed protein product [Echinostoma caproni]|uniref:ABC transporter family G domain-containing protein n=1 Tax=Echinostoma caproni TaxID=27848 RepID=A0A3P8GFN4_9TREM|nr:unnamed protein product [Echinostoma caproni]